VLSEILIAAPVTKTSLASNDWFHCFLILDYGSGFVLLFLDSPFIFLGVLLVPRKQVKRGLGGAALRMGAAVLRTDLTHRAPAIHLNSLHIPKPSNKPPIIEACSDIIDKENENPFRKHSSNVATPCRGFPPNRLAQVRDFLQCTHTLIKSMEPESIGSNFSFPTNQTPRSPRKW
jgi:hypothetical protein